MLKKINIVEFCEFINENMDVFQEEVESRNFSNRNQGEWMKLLQDYLGLNKSFDELTEQEQEGENYTTFYEEELGLDKEEEESRF